MAKIRLLCAALMIFLLLGVLSACATREPTDGEYPVLRENLCWAVGAPLPVAEDFAETLPEGSAIEFDGKYSFPQLGTYSIKLTWTASNGYRKTYDASFTLVVDDEAPVIVGARDLPAYIGGSGVSYKNGVTVRDNCGGKIDLQIDTSAVDLRKTGEYPVIYTATDGAGNSASVTVKVHVYEMEITLEMLNQIVDKVLTEKKITAAATKEEQCRMIYSYVHGIAWTAGSDKTDWIRAAYFGLTGGDCDCYTYYAMSKAFFERLGIENLCLQRTAEASAYLGETHFWNYVNIGTPESPKWYHFDATRLAEGSKNCLITEEQLSYYNEVTRQKYCTAKGVRSDAGYFYAYDPTGIPTSATKQITVDFY